jgi:hypothetical protein
MGAECGIERLWRTVKQEEVYIRDYSDGLDAHQTHIPHPLRGAKANFKDFFNLIKKQ